MDWVNFQPHSKECVRGRVLELIRGILEYSDLDGSRRLALSILGGDIVESPTSLPSRDTVDRPSVIYLEAAGQLWLDRPNEVPAGLWRGGQTYFLTDPDLCWRVLIPKGPRSWFED